ncbi:TPA: glycosyltransferase, partial [Candidatus Woesearchaeota archaeon]|nr:glycosyltransferase [Candidatus Woesearchaeota archaeon]
VYFLHGYLKDKEVSSLYQHPKVKGLISLTHGEGFGLPLLEAAACGLPVLATNWSAHTEFLNLGNWSKVHGKIEPIPKSKIDGTIFIEGAKWANPDIKSARIALQDFVDSKNALEDCQLLKQRVRNAYSFGKISKRYDKFWKRWQ